MEDSEVLRKFYSESLDMIHCECVVSIYTGVVPLTELRGGVAGMTANQLAYWNLQETKRSNLVDENERRRSNLAREKEANRSNVAKERETNRSNVARERETNRANVVQEGISSGLAQSQREKMRAETDLTNMKSISEGVNLGFDSVNSILGLLDTITKFL